MPTINDIKPRAFRSIPIKVYEELKQFNIPGVSINGADPIPVTFTGFGDGELEWIEGVPYGVSVI